MVSLITIYLTTSLYDLNLFDLNVNLDSNLSSYENLLSHKLQSRYFSPHSFHQMKSKFSKSDVNSCFTLFHNNIVSLNSNLENLQTHILDELDFHFDIIGVSETKITNANVSLSVPNIPGYNIEFVPTPQFSFWRCRVIH